MKIIQAGNYVYKMEVNYSLLTEGLTLPVDNQVIFGQIAGRFLKPGESKPIHIFLNGKTYDAEVRNVKFNPKYNRNVMQIRYRKNGDLALMLQKHFHQSYKTITEGRAKRPKGSREQIRAPEGEKEYLAIYTTEYDDTYVFETIELEDVVAVAEAVRGKSERVLEAEFNFDTTDDTAGLNEKTRIVKFRKLNKKIGDNLKLLYGYRCQICGCLVGEDYGSKVVEAHHIDYFVESLNNDANNQLIVCPNHHSIIHDVDPVFNRKTLHYQYHNGKIESLALNKHLQRV